MKQGFRFQQTAAAMLGAGMLLSALSTSSSSVLVGGSSVPNAVVEEHNLEILSEDNNLPSFPDRPSTRRLKRKTNDDPRTVQLKSDHKVVGNLERPSTVYATSDAKPVPKRIFGCMARKSAIESLFPKFEGKIINLGYGKRQKLADLDKRYKLNKDEDIIVGLLHQAEHCIDNVIEFPGKQIYFNPEPLDWMPCTPQREEDHLYYLNMSPEIAFYERDYNYLPPSEDIVVIGPHETTTHSLQVFVGVLYFVLHQNEEELRRALHKLILPEYRPHNTQEYFMGYFQSHYVKEREDGVALLAKAFYERFGNKVHVGTKCQGSPTALRPTGGQARFCGAAKGEALNHIEVIEEKENGLPNFLNNDDMMRHYKYIIAFENMDRDAYVSEKIFNAFMSGAVPVYWGTKDVFKLFNADAFIYFDMNDPQAAIDQITFLEEHPEAYESMLQQPILADGWETVKQYFSLRDDVGHGRLRKMIMSKMGFDAKTV